MVNKIIVLSGISLFATAFAVSNSSHLRGLGFAAPTVNGKSNVYDPVPGEIIYDSSDSKFYGRTQTPTWVDLSYSAESVTPTGAILPFAGAAAPSGFLIADGSAVSRTTYASLFAVIGTAYGSGDGSTTFNIPDLRGRFLRGVDGSAGNDPNSSTRTASAAGGNAGNNVGSAQADAFASHSHVQTYGGFVGGGVYTVQGLNNYQTAVTSNVSTQSTGGSETRPKNIYVNFLVKY